MRFIETMLLYLGRIELFDYHQSRIDETATAHDFVPPQLDQKALIAASPYGYTHHKVMCRVVYSAKGVEEITYREYQKREVKSLSVVESDIAYAFKYEDRSELAAVLERKGNCDDVIICSSNGVGDCSYANLVFEKDGEFFTSTTPLLKGVRRSYLIDSGVVKETEIGVEDIAGYERVHLVNGMLTIGEVVVSGDMLCYLLHGGEGHR